MCRDCLSYCSSHVKRFPPTAIRLAGNILREDFSFRHSFSSDVAKLLKASPGQIVIVQPEKFRSKHEPASHTLTVKVLSLISFHFQCVLFLTSGDLNWFHEV